MTLINHVGIRLQSIMMCSNLYIILNIKSVSHKSRTFCLNLLFVVTQYITAALRSSLIQGLSMSTGVMTIAAAISGFEHPLSCEKRT